MELLKHVQTGDENRFKAFCEALATSGQQNIVDMLYSNDAGGDTTDAVPCNTGGTDLSPLRKSMLSNSWTNLVDDVISDVEFLSYLKSYKVFTDLKITALMASN